MSVTSTIANFAKKTTPGAFRKNWWSAWPTHWVVLTRPVKLSYAQIDMKVFTWGSETHRVSTKTDDFLHSYYGYVLVGK